MARHLFTSESVTEGHPDKVADLISDAILDECLKQDKNSRVAVETLISKDKVIVAGQITSNATIDIEKIVREKFVENFTRRFAESTLIIGTKYTIKFFDVMEEPPKVSVRIDTGIDNYKIYNTSGDYKVLNQLTGIFEYIGKDDNGKAITKIDNPYEEKEKKMTYYSIVKKSNATGKYDTTLELNLPDELVSGKIKNVTLSNVEYQDASNLTQGELNTAILQRELYFKNANNDYDYFLTLANIEKNMYNRNSIKISKQDEYKISINSISSGSKDYAIIKYITTWKYEEYKYKLS